MAVYTDITDEELGSLLADFDLGAPLSLKGVAEGVENSNFLLETEAGRYFLTVYERRVNAADLPFFLELMAWLAGHGFPSATPIADRAGRLLKTVRGKPCAIVSFLSGLSVRRPTAAHCREAGEGLAQLHLAADGFSGSRSNDLGQAAWAPMFEGLREAAENLKPGLAKTISFDLERLSAKWPADLPRGVIHADYFPDNVFFKAGRFAGAIDFYFACVDALAYDIAVALNAWCFEPDGSFNITSARQLVAGYESRRPLSAAERAALPVLAHGAAMRFFLTRLHDWGATPEGALVRPKDPLEYERKLAVHRASPDLVLFGDGRMTPQVVIHTDGACSGNPGPGGWGAVLHYGDKEKELWGGELATTNNRMEMMAAIQALEALKRPCRVELHTDSKYVQQGIKEWIHGWKARGWKTADKKPVKNEDLWKRLDQARLRHEVDWRWIKGHAGHEFNERADELARRGLDEARAANAR